MAMFPVRRTAIRLPKVLLLAFTLAMSAPIVAAPAESYAPKALHDLTSVEQFRDLFNQEAGSVRLVLLLSPT